MFYVWLTLKAIQSPLISWGEKRREDWQSCSSLHSPSNFFGWPALPRFPDQHRLGRTTIASNKTHQHNSFSIHNRTIFSIFCCFTVLLYHSLYWNYFVCETQPGYWTDTAGLQRLEESPLQRNRATHPRLWQEVCTSDRRVRGRPWGSPVPSTWWKLIPHNLC